MYLRTVIAISRHRYCLRSGQCQRHHQRMGTPSQNTHPHDTEIGPDGSLWYTGQYANVIGRLDIQTGKIREYTIKKPNSGPHGLVADKEGNIWFTANNSAYIGKLNPANGEITEYPMPDPAARDPHTPLFDPNGILWFTVQQGNFVGKLDPKTGKVTLKQSPTPRSAPYGLRMDSKVRPGIANSAATRSRRSIRRPWKSRSTSCRKALGRGGLRSRQTTLFIIPTINGDISGVWIRKAEKSTSGPRPVVPRPGLMRLRRCPTDPIWYSESNVSPNTMVRFDPKDNSFMKWSFRPAEALRHFVPNKQGDKIYIACSGVNKVGIVEITKK